MSERASRMVARAGVEPAARCFKDSSPYRYRVPGRVKLGAGEWNRTTKVSRLRIYSPLSPPPARRRHACTERADVAKRREATSRVEVVEPTGIAPASPACKAGALLLSYGPEFLVDPGGSAPPSPDCEPGALLVERWAREYLWWTHRESNPDLQNAILTSFLWTMSPWCRPPVLPRILLVFSQACDFYTRAA